MKSPRDMETDHASSERPIPHNTEEQCAQNESGAKKRGRPRLPSLISNDVVLTQTAKVQNHREQQRRYQARKKLKKANVKVQLCVVPKLISSSSEHPKATIKPDNTGTHIDYESNKERANPGIEKLDGAIIKDEDIQRTSNTRKRGRPRLSAATLERLPKDEMRKILNRRKYQQEYRAQKKLKKLTATPMTQIPACPIDPSSISPTSKEDSDMHKVHKDVESRSMEAIEAMPNMASMEQNDKNIVIPTVDTSNCNSTSRHWQKQIAIMQQDMKPAGHEPLKWTKKCCTCQIDLLESESMLFCCNNGRRLLPPLESLPQILEELYSTNKFSNNSRIVNNLFCFTALGVEGDFIDLKMPSSVAIMGRTYHRLLSADTPTSTLHWYIYDSTMRYTIATNMQVPSTWIMQVATVLDAINPYAKELKTIKELHPAPIRLTLADSSASDEIAAIVHANNSVTIKPRTAMVWMRHNHNPVFLSILDPTYEPLQYPLFFPHGTPGWHPHNDQKMSQIDWYRTRLLHEPRFSQLGRLCGEYLVDMYSRVEEERLNYIVTEGYRRNLMQHEDDFDDDEDPDARYKTLPASFLGSR